MKGGMQGTFIFSGTGNAEGVPVICCSCEICSSANNERLRSAGILKIGDKTFLVDLGPDLRRQLLRYKIDHIDGALLTHIHYDHAAGMDDLRAFNMLTALPVNLTLSAFSYEQLSVMKPYLIFGNGAEGSLTASFDFNILTDDTGEGFISGIPFRYVSYRQGKVRVTGFRFGNFAYLVDLQKYDPVIKDSLLDLDTLVLTVSPYEGDIQSMHLSFQDACGFADDIGVKHLVITHVGHRTVFPEKNHRRYGDVTVAHDGLTVEFQL